MIEIKEADSEDIKFIESQVEFINAHFNNMIHMRKDTKVLGLISHVLINCISDALSSIKALYPQSYETAKSHTLEMLKRQLEYKEAYVEKRSRQNSSASH